MKIAFTFFILIVLPLLMKNNKFFPLVFLLGFTDILHFTYGINNYLLFSFGGGATGNIFLSYYYYLILVILIFQKIKNNLNIKFYYNELFILIFILILFGLLSSIQFGFYFQSLARVLRGFLNYLNYVYLTLFFLESRENTIRFVRTLYLLVLISFLLQVIEIIIQKRLIIDAIAPDILYAGSYFMEDVFIIIPGVGNIFYSWSRVYEFIPLAIFFSAYFYYTKTKIKPYSNLLIFSISILALVLSLSRLALIVSTIMILMFLFLNARIKFKESLKLTLYFTSISLVILLIAILETPIYKIIYSRFFMTEDLVYGQDTALPRLVVFEMQLSHLKESFFFGKGFSFRDTFLAISPDLGISNFLPMFGLVGLIFPILILIKTIKYLIQIGRFEIEFFNSFLIIFTGYFVIYPFFQDYYLSSSIFIVPLISLINTKLNNYDWLKNLNEKNNKKNIIFK